MTGRMEAAATALYKAKYLEGQAEHYTLWDGDSAGDEGTSANKAESMDWSGGAWSQAQWEDWRAQQHQAQQQVLKQNEEQERFVQLQRQREILQGQLEQARAQQKRWEDEDARKAEELHRQQTEMEELQRSGQKQELAAAIAACEAEAARSAGNVIGHPAGI